MKDKVAVVTGASSGIGLAVARAFIDAGMKVAMGARNRQRLENAAAGLGKNALAVAADVSDAGQVARLFDDAASFFGGIDVLVNNAGIGGWGNIDEMPIEKWNHTQEVNLHGAYLCARAAWPHLKARGGGYVFNISSIAGIEGFGGATAYAASKHALVGLSESLSEEGIPHNIKVTAICPGYVDTPMVAGADVPPEEMIQPDDIGATCLYLMALSRPTLIPRIVMRRMAL